LSYCFFLGPVISALILDYLWRIFEKLGYSDGSGWRATLFFTLKHFSTMKNWLLSTLQSFNIKLIKTLLVILLLNSTQVGFAQEPELCTFSAVPNLTCDGVSVTFTAGNPNFPNNYWDFGDGSPIVMGGMQISHNYVDVNPYSPTLKARHSYNNQDWCEKEGFLPDILVGTGCGSNRKISQLLSTGVLPANELIGRDLYVFGNLEIDVPYIFNQCKILVRPGGQIIVKSGGTLTLRNNTIADALFISGSADCRNLWNGIEVFSGGSLITDGATIQNAYFAVRPIRDNPNSLPVLSLKQTTFKRNFVGIYSANGNFVLSNFRDNTFEGSGNTAIYPASVCSQVNGLPYAQRTYCGIYFNGSLGGSLLMPNKSINNVFKNLQAGIVCINGTSFIQGCRFENINYLPNNSALYQATAITFIDNFGKKSLSVVGLGKLGTPTVNNCERGIYATTSSHPSALNISNCRMIEVQNGIDIDATGIGNFSKGIIKENSIGCTKHVPNIKQRSTGIEWKDPSIFLSDFSITGNDIVVDQPEAVMLPGNPEIIPTAIQVVAMHLQTSNNAMTLKISSKVIDLVNGLNGIVVENVANAEIIENVIDNTTEPQIGVIFRFIWVFGGFNNSIVCNTATNFLDGLFEIGGVICEGTLNVNVSKNTLTNQQVNLAFVGDHGTDCTVSYNDFTQTFFPNLGASIVYNEARTGPQYLRGNDWIGNFSSAQFGQGGGSFSYCESLYHVSNQANTHDVLFGNPMDCDGITGNDLWFTTLEVVEDDLS
jgi:hypothetical protein